MQFSSWLFYLSMASTLLNIFAGLRTGKGLINSKTRPNGSNEYEESLQSTPTKKISYRKYPHYPIDIIRISPSKIILRKSSNETIQIESSSSHSEVHVTKVSSNKALYNAYTPTYTVDGIFGVYNFPFGSYVVVIAKSEPDYSFGNDGVRKIIDIELIKVGSLVNSDSATDTVTEKLIRDAFSRHTFFFSVSDYDVTNNLPRNEALKACYPHFHWKQCDERFFWNLNVISVLIDSKLDDWITPITNAWVSTQTLVIRGERLKFSIISRRSRRHQGPRYNM